MIEATSHLSPSSPMPLPAEQSSSAANALSTTSPASPSSEHIPLKSLRSPTLEGSEASKGPQPKLRGMVGKVIQQRIANGEASIELRQAHARQQIAALAPAAIQLVRQDRVAKAAYLEQAAALMADDHSYRLPAAFSGKVVRDGDGHISCSDKAVEAILHFVGARYPDALAALHFPEGGCELSLPLDPAIFVKTEQFENGCQAFGLQLKDGSIEASKINLTAYATRQAIKKGVQGFGGSAVLNQNNSLPAGRNGLSADDEADATAPSLGRIDSGSSAEHSRAQAFPQGEVHPFKFLQDVRYSVDSTHAPLKALVEQCLNESDGTTLELRARMGAHAINTVINNKAFTWQLGAAMLVSLVASGGAAYALDSQAWKAIIGIAAKQYGEHHPITQLAEVLLESLTPLVAETLDSLVVKRLLGTFQGEPLWFSSFDEFSGDLLDAAKSGGVAAVGAIANNAVSLSDSWGAFPAQIATNQLAASTSAAMVPREVGAAHNDMVAGVAQKMGEGFYPLMQRTAAADASPVQADKALQVDLKNETQSTLEVAPGWGMAINSMGVGSVLSLAAGFLPIDIPARLHLLSESIQKIATIMVNTPTEVLSLGAGILTANHLGGVGTLMTTDAEKNRLVMKLIVDKAIQRASSADPSRSIDITEEELRAIEHPRLALTQPAGKGIVKAMNETTDFIAKGWASAFARPAPETLADTVDLRRIAQQMPGSFPETV